MNITNLRIKSIYTLKMKYVMDDFALGTYKKIVNIMKIFPSRRITRHLSLKRVVKYKEDIMSTILLKLIKHMNVKSNIFRI